MRPLRAGVLEAKAASGAPAFLKAVFHHGGGPRDTEEDRCVGSGGKPGQLLSEAPFERQYSPQRGAEDTQTALRCVGKTGMKLRPGREGDFGYGMLAIRVPSECRA